jgi:hypothetical protein
MKGCAGGGMGCRSRGEMRLCLVLRGMGLGGILHERLMALNGFGLCAGLGPLTTGLLSERMAGLSGLNMRV